MLKWIINEAIVMINKLIRDLVLTKWFPAYAFNLYIGLGFGAHAALSIVQPMPHS